MATILITDSLFLPIGGVDEQRIRAAGFEIDRLDVVKADEETLIEHIRGKVGYLLGGIERVTEPVLAAADQLRAIAFTGSGYTEFIPAWKSATERGIAISAARGENAEAVSEWTLASGLALARNIPALTSPGGLSFAIAHDFSALTWGVIGYGAIGRSVASKARSLGFNVIATGAGEGVKQVALDVLLEMSDVISIHVSKRRGVGVVDANAIALMKSGAVLVNSAFEEAIDNVALLGRISAGEVRAAVDYPLSGPDTPVGSLLASNSQTAYNTAETNARVGSRATTSLLNLLATGTDDDLVNPEYINRSQ